VIELLCGALHAPAMETGRDARPGSIAARIKDVPKVKVQAAGAMGTWPLCRHQRLWRRDGLTRQGGIPSLDGSRPGGQPLITRVRSVSASKIL